MAELIIVKDKEGNWKRNIHNRLPHYYDIVFGYEDKQYELNGRFDERIFDTEEKALQEARYILKLEQRSRITNTDYTQEQRDAMNCYQNVRSKLTDAVHLVRNLEFLTEEEANLPALKKEAKEKRQACLDLEINVV